jgi:hypothetical protein
MTSAYLDLLQVTHPRRTEHGEARRRRQARNRGLLLQVRDAFDALGVDRLSTLERPALAVIDALATFTRLGADRLHTTDIIEALEDEETWSEWASIPLPAAARELAELLEEHDVRPRSVTVAGRRARGYLRLDLEAAAQRLADETLLNDNDDIEKD